MMNPRVSRIQNVGVVFCTSPALPAGREYEKVADAEVEGAARSVRDALLTFGYQVDLIDLDPARIADLRSYDWIINLSESIYGYPLKDYEVTKAMEDLGIPFTGSGSSALATCLNKAETKAILADHEILTPAYALYPPLDGQHISWELPAIVKPVHEDGSVGITSHSIANSSEDLRNGIERIHNLYRQAALVEEYIVGRDITASILGTGAEAQVLPLSEIHYPERHWPNILTFEAKWVEESQDYRDSAAVCPCALEPDVEETIRATALEVYRIMNCRDYARIDFRLQGSKAYVLEVNPNPCINPQDSGYVRAGMAAGYTYPELVHQIMISSVKTLAPVMDTGKPQV